MPQSGSYAIRRGDRFKAKLSKKSQGAVAAVELAEKALAANPHKPLPEEDYPVEEIPTSARVTEMHIAVTVYSMKIKNTGLTVTYTVREFEKVVLMEDLEQSWRSQLGIHPE